MTSDPVVALQAGASEDEAVAKNTPGGGTANWRPAVDRDDEQNVAGYSVISGPDDYVASAGGLGPVDGAGVVTHIARQGPSGTLARVAAYRKILTEYGKAGDASAFRAGLLFAIEQLADAYDDTRAGSAPEMRDA